MKLEVSVEEVRLRAPLRSAHTLTEVRPLVQVRLAGDDGVVGFGEAAPLESYDGVTVPDVLAALEAWRPEVEAGRPFPKAGPAPARACLDLAGWDMAGRRAGEPVWRLLGASAAPALAVNATIGAEAPEAAAAQASRARAAGFPCVKVKVGVADDLERVRAVREAAGDTLIRLDANGAWSVAEAIAALEALAPFGIECCEEPVHGRAGLAQVARSADVAVAADESASGDLLRERICAAVCLKISASGGITGLLHDARLARKAGYELYLASTLDGPLGIAAALHCASIVAPDRPSGLATLARFVAADPLPPVEGVMTAPAGPGLGFVPSLSAAYHRMP